jgi:hypothetical protein
MFNSRRLALLRKLPRAPFHQEMSGKSGGYSNMMLFLAPALAGGHVRGACNAGY